MKDYFLDSGKYNHWIKTFIVPMEQRVNSLVEYRKLFKPPYLLLNNDYYKSSNYGVEDALPIFSNDFLSALNIFDNSEPISTSLYKLDLNTGYINNLGKDIDLELHGQTQTFSQGWYVFKIVNHARTQPTTWSNFALMPYSVTRNVYMPNTSTNNFENWFPYSVYTGAIDIFGKNMAANWFNFYYRYVWKNESDGLHTFGTNADKQFIISSNDIVASNIESATTIPTIHWVYPDHLFVNFLDSNNEEVFLDELSREATIKTENDTTVQTLKITFGHSISNKKIQVF